jgi:hypothetical protein
MKNNPPESMPVIRVSFQSSLGDKRGAVFETYLAQDATEAEIGALMDKLRRVCDRQDAITSTVLVRRELETSKAQLAALKADMARVEDTQLAKWIESGRKGDFKLSAAEAQHRQNLEGSIINRVKAIELIETQLKEYESIAEAK